MRGPVGVANGTERRDRLLPQLELPKRDLGLDIDPKSGEVGNEDVRSMLPRREQPDEDAGTALRPTPEQPHVGRRSEHVFMGRRLAGRAFGHRPSRAG